MEPLLRRDFVKQLLALGALPAVPPGALGGMTALQGLAAAVNQESDPEAADFWNGFLGSPVTPLTEVPRPGARAIVTRGAPPGLERQAFFFHYGPQGFRPALDLASGDLVPEGDVTLSLNVSAFRPAAIDRQRFETLQSAQLRLDVLQTIPIIELLDTAAWTAMALLLPDPKNRLPAIQDLTFDPATVWQKMQNIVLPGGEGQWAFNLYGQRKDGFFSKLMQTLTTEVGRFAPVLGLPGISKIALQSFNAFYGALHTRPDYIFQSFPVPVFATTQSMQRAGTSRGVPLRTGTYILVPLAHAEQMTPDRLDGMEVRQGLLVPRGTPTVSVYAAAEKALPDVTYATLDVVVRPANLQCGRRT